MSVSIDVWIVDVGHFTTDFTNFSWRLGRTSKSETFTPSTASLTIRNLSTMSAGFVLGAQVIISGGIGSFFGVISNIEYFYGEVPNMDYAVVSFEGKLAGIGRQNVNSFTFSGGLTTYEAQRLAAALTGSAKTISGSTGRSYTNNTTTYTGAALNVLQTLAATEQGRLSDQPQLYFWGRDSITDPAIYPNEDTNFYFTDDTADTTGIHYSDIVFGSVTDSYFTQAQIQPDGLATQTTGSGDRNITISTYDANTTQAADLALYVLNEFNNNTPNPISITTSSALVNGYNAVSLASNYRPGVVVRIVFRGNTYYTIGEGWQINATPEQVRTTIYLSPFEQNNYLHLDSAGFGRLDYNQLSF